MAVARRLAAESGGMPRPVPYRRLSAALYGLLALLMATAVALALNGILRAADDAARALALRDTAQRLVPAVLDLAQGEAAVEAATGPLRDWIIGQAPDPAMAADRLDAVLADDDPGNPRAVAREIGDAFARGDVDGPFLTAWLQLSLRNDVESAGETISNALALNAGVDLPRREVDDVFAVYLARTAGEEVPAEELAAADALAARISALPEAVAVAAVYTRAALLMLALAAAALTTGWLALRFARDAVTVWQTGCLYRKRP